jgi:hypothetical protein
MTFAKYHKIDVYSHFLPPGYADAMIRAGLPMANGMPGYPEWNPELALAVCDRLGVATTIPDLERASLLVDRERFGLYRENALALLPQLRAIEGMPGRREPGVRYLKE